MVSKTRSGLLGLLVLLCASCQQQMDEYRAEFFVFGTLVEVVIRDVTREQADKAFAELRPWLQALHRDLHAWEPGMLTSFNQAIRRGEAGNAEGDIATLVAYSTFMEVVTGGRFNAAAGGLVRLWGFHTSVFPVNSPPPGESEIRAWLAAAPSMSQIQISEGRGRSANPSVQLDFGGIAKGFAVDRAFSVLAGLGLESFLVNAGGDLRAIGGSPDKPWRVGIRSGGEVIGGVHIASHAAVFTSGAGERYAETAGQRYPHILDPRNGRPVAGIQSVTIVQESGWTATGWFADAAATALMVAGPEEWLQLAADLQLNAVLVIHEDGDMVATGAMMEKLVIEDSVASRIEAVQLPAGKPLPRMD